MDSLDTLAFGALLVAAFATCVWLLARIQKENQRCQKTEERLQDALRLNELKTLFFANMSHEIRTPLGSIHGFAKLLETEPVSDEERKRFAGIIQSAATNLANIVNDILDLSKIESGRLKIDKKNLNLKDLLDEIRGLLEIKAKEKNIQLVFHLDEQLPERIFCDPLRLKQILLNLLGNAIKFTHKGRVSLEAQAQGERLIFEIRDTGVGIPFHLSKQIFEPFEQGKRDAAEQYGGTGLGLPLSKQLVELLGGELSLVSSLPGKGTYFKFQIDYERPIEIPQTMAQL